MKKRPAAMKKAAMKKRPAARKKRPAAVKKRPAVKKIYVAAAPSDTIHFDAWPDGLAFHMCKLHGLACEAQENADRLVLRVDRLETKADRSWAQGEEVLEALRRLNRQQQVRLLPYQSDKASEKPQQKP